MTTKSSKALDPSRIEVQISYCAVLGIYHYVRTDGDEFFFDDDKLEQSIAVYLSQGKKKDAEYMALLTADARKNPHKILVYRGGKPPRIVDPVSLSPADAKSGNVTGDKTPKKG